MAAFSVKPIGYVHKPEDSDPFLEILAEYKTGIYRLDTISHIFVLWWLNESDTPDRRITKVSVPRVRNSLVPAEEMGNLATRSPNRPNPIALTLVKIIKIDDRKIYVDEIEAFEGSPILDIKPYLPNGDRVDEEIFLPKWFEHLLVSRPPDRRQSKP